MKNILFVLLLTISSILSFAGVIMTSSNERLEDVTITNENDSAIVYMQNGEEKFIAIEQVSAILYDDGQYKEINHSVAISDVSNTNDTTSININSDSINVKNMLSLAFDPRVLKIASDPAFLPYYQSIEKEAKTEYEVVYQLEIAKGTSKKEAKKNAKQARDSIRTIRVLEYVNKYPSNK